jgi:hypothetical protein
MVGHGFCGLCDPQRADVPEWHECTEPQRFGAQRHASDGKSVWKRWRGADEIAATFTA